MIKARTGLWVEPLVRSHWVASWGRCCFRDAAWSFLPMPPCFPLPLPSTLSPPPLEACPTMFFRAAAKRPTPSVQPSLDGLLPKSLLFLNSLCDAQLAVPGWGWKIPSPLLLLSPGCLPGWATHQALRTSSVCEHTHLPGREERGCAPRVP